MGERKRKERPDGILLFGQSMKMLQLLSDEAAGKAIKAAVSYFLTQADMPDDGSTAFLCYSVLKVDIDSGLERFRELCQRNAENRNKGNEASRVVTSGDENRKEINISEMKRNDIEMSGEEIRSQDTPAPQKKNVSFVPPSLNEVQQLCKEKGYVTSPTKFYNFYAASGWKGIIDWKAKLAQWAEDDAKKQVSNKTDSVAQIPS